MKIRLLAVLVLIFNLYFVKAQTTTNYGTDSGTQGDYNSFFGYQSGYNNTESYNTFFGWRAGFYNTSGRLNVFMGTGAGYKNTIGTNNVFIGHFSGYNNTTGDVNMFSGFYAGVNNISGAANVFLGNYAGRNNITGRHNAFTGYDSGRENTDGEYNVFYGSQSGRNNTEGDKNLCIGYQSGYSNILGNYNTIVGNEAGYSATGTNNIFIGYKSGYNETGNDKLYIDNSDTSTPLIFGDFATNQLGVNTNTIPTDYAFAVKGKIISEEITVKIYPWADFVFEDDYNLPTLEEVENYINEKGHLIDIPTAKEVSENGVNVGEMEAKLLQKIEELTLYTIQQEKEIKNQKEINKNLEDRLLKLEYLIKQLSKN